MANEARAHGRTTDSAQPTWATGHDGTLEPGIHTAVDALLPAFELEPLGGDRFRAVSEMGRFSQIFGGQLAGQAVLAAGSTVTDKNPHSMHAYFVDTGTPDEPVELGVDRVRDGRSTSTRRVTVEQAGRPLLTAMASFHTGRSGPERAKTAPSVPAPDQLPTLQECIRGLPPEQYALGNGWIEHPPPLELRFSEAPSYLSGLSRSGTRSHWMRLPRELGDDSLLHTSLLAYASDYFLVDMAVRFHPERDRSTPFNGISLDHAIWFHRPVRFDDWHLHTQEALALTGDRCLVRGMIHDADGHLVASVAQDTLIRPM